MKKVAVASGDYLVYLHPFTLVSNVFMRNGTYPLMFIGWVYNSLACMTENHLINVDCELLVKIFSSCFLIRFHYQLSNSALSQTHFAVKCNT